MRIPGWIYGSYVDPRFRLTPEERDRVHKLVHEKYLRGGTLAAYTFALIAAGWLMVAVGSIPFSRLLARVGVPGAMTVSTVTICIVAVVAAAWIYRCMYAKPMRRAMRDLGYPLCVACGYRLDGHATPTRCPECGADAPLDLPQTDAEDRRPR